MYVITAVIDLITSDPRPIVIVSGRELLRNIKRMFATLNDIQVQLDIIILLA